MRNLATLFLLMILEPRMTIAGDFCSRALETAYEFRNIDLRRLEIDLNQSLESIQWQPATKTFLMQNRLKSIGDLQFYFYELEKGSKQQAQVPEEIKRVHDRVANLSKSLSPEDLAKIAKPDWDPEFVYSNARLAAARPRWSAEKDSNLVVDYVAAYPKKYRPVGQFIVDNVQHISQQEFENSLHRCIDRVVEKVDSGSELVLIGSAVYGSNNWVAKLALEYLQNSAKKSKKKLTISAFAKKAEAKAYLEAHPHLNAIFVDDAVYSGTQMSGDIYFHHPQTGVTLKKGKSFIVAPYITNYAKYYIQSLVDAEIVNDAIMPTLSELLEKPGVDQGVKTKFESLFPEDDLDSKTLTYFDHTIADFASVLSLSYADGDGTSEVTVLEGAVPNAAGSIAKLVPFIRKPDKPY